jgi:hypothetical protein
MARKRAIAAPPAAPLPDDVRSAIVDALASALLADLKLDVEATHDVGEDPEQDETH